MPRRRVPVKYIWRLECLRRWEGFRSRRLAISWRRRRTSTRICVRSTRQAPRRSRWRPFLGTVWAKPYAIASRAPPRHANFPSMTELYERLATRLGPKGYATDAGDLAPYLKEWRGAFAGSTPFLAIPANTEEVADVVRLCAEAG